MKRPGVSGPYWKSPVGALAAINSGSRLIDILVDTGVAYLVLK